MKRYALTVLQPTGTWAIWGNGSLAVSIDDFLAKEQSQIARFNRFGDTWRVVEVPNNPNMPVVPVYYPEKSS